MKNVNILGTEYKVYEANESNDVKLIDKDGYCDTSVKECVVDEMNSTTPQPKRKAFLNTKKA